MDIAKKKRYETMMIVRSYLLEQGLEQTATSLVNEGALVVDHFKLRDMLMAGSFAQAEDYLATFQDLANNLPGWSLVSFLLRKQTFLEKIQRGEIDNARIFLNKQLRPLQASPYDGIYTVVTEFLKSCDGGCLPLPTRDSLVESLGIVFTSSGLYSIDSPIQVEPERLHKLFEESLNWQFKDCKNPSHDSNVATLLKDHECTPRHLQSSATLKRKGLVNRGNLCFLNSSLQALLSCSHFMEFIQRLPHDLDKDIYPTLAAFSEFNLHHSDVQRRIILPQMFEVVLDRFTPDFIPNNFNSRQRQEDVPDFLTNLIQQMDNDFEKLGTAQRQENVPPSEIFRLVVVEKGDKDSGKVVSHSVVPLPIDSEKVSTIEEALQVFFAPEHDSESATKSMKIQKPADVMVLQLGRFSYDSSTKKCTKLHKVVQFPIKLNLGAYASTTNNKELSYELVATISHIGEKISGGHYTANALVNGEWLHLNDNEVTKIETPKVLDGQAYVLFYQQSFQEKTFRDMINDVREDFSSGAPIDRNDTYMERNLSSGEDFNRDYDPEDQSHVPILSLADISTDMDIDFDDDPEYISILGLLQEAVNSEGHSTVPIAVLHESPPSPPTDLSTSFSCSTQITAIEFHPRLAVLLVCEERGTTRLQRLTGASVGRITRSRFSIWNPEKLSKPYKDHFAKSNKETEARCVAWGSPENNTIYGVGFSLGLIHLYKYIDSNREKPSEQHLEIEAHLGGVSSMVFYSFDGKLMLLTCGHDKRIKVWDSSKELCLASYLHMEPLKYMVVPKQQYRRQLPVIVTDVTGTTVKTYINSSGEPNEHVALNPEAQAQQKDMIELKFSTSGERLFSGIIGTPRLVELDGNTLQVIREYQGVSINLTQCCMDVSNYIAVLCGEEKCIKFWKLDTTTEPFRRKDYLEPPFQDSPILRFDMNGSRLAVVYGKYTKTFESKFIGRS